MVAIDIRKSDKVSGEWGMFLSFPYNEQLLGIIRALPSRYWHSDTKEWEVPLNKLTELIDSMGGYEVQLTGELDALAERKVPDIQFNFKTQPFDHQIEGFNYGLTHNKWLLGDQPGLGKTWQVINIALAKKQLYGYKHCLIICGVNGLKWNWVEEIHTHSNEDCHVLGQRINKRGKTVIKRNADKVEDINNIDSLPYFIITNIESLRDDKILMPLKALCDNGSIDMIAMDECHKCFDSDTLIYTDKGQLKIGDIVTNQLKVSVMTFNEHTHEFEWKPITNWFKNFVNEPLLELKVNTSKGIKTIKCTRTHKIYTNNRGWVSAEDLTVDDDIQEC